LSDEDRVLKMDLSFLYFFISTLFYAKSTKGIKRLTKEEKAVFYIPNNLRNVIVGIMLSDGHI